MKKIKTQSKPQQQKNIAVTHRVRTIVLCIAVVITAQLAIDCLLFLHSIRSNDDGSVILSLISQAVDGENKPAMTDPVASKVYLVDAHVVLPLQAPPLDQILYSYNPALGSTAATLQVTTRQAVMTSKARVWSASATSSFWQTPDDSKLFAKVPELQACARGVAGVFGATAPVTAPGKLVSTAHLQDGRTVRWYLEQPEKCQIDLSPLATALAQATSY